MTNWTPQPGMRIKSVVTGKFATIVKLYHRADRDTGAMWEIREDDSIVGNSLAYEANLTSYWEPAPQERKP